LAGRRLFLMRPADLLARASVLDVEVDRESSADAGRVALTEIATPGDVALWMCDELERTGTLLQADAVASIKRDFGPGFIYINKNGNPAIDERVLRDIRELTRGHRRLGSSGAHVAAHPAGGSKDCGDVLIGCSRGRSRRGGSGLSDVVERRSPGSGGARPFSTAAWMERRGSLPQITGAGPGTFVSPSTTVAIHG
jgi:hypothetical protein